MSDFEGNCEKNNRIFIILNITFLILFFLLSSLAGFGFLSKMSQKAHRMQEATRLFGEFFAVPLFIIAQVANFAWLICLIADFCRKKNIWKRVCAVVHHDRCMGYYDRL